MLVNCTVLYCKVLSRKRLYGVQHLHTFAFAAVDRFHVPAMQ